MTGWSNYSTKEKIYIVAKKMHILKPFQFVNRRILKQDIKSVESRKKVDFSDKYTRFYRDLDRLSQVHTKQNILVSGYISTFRKGGNNFFHCIERKLPNSRIIALSQSGVKLTEKNRNQIEFELLSLPIVPFKGGYRSKENAMITDEMLKTIEEKQYLKDAIYNIKSYHDDMGEGYVEALVYYLYLATKDMISNLDLRLVIVHNKLYPLHDVMCHVCEELEIPVIYFEFGAIPGTFVLEQEGQMGASIIAKDIEGFFSKQISDEDVFHASDVISYLRDSGLNRNEQPVSNELNRIKENLKENRPVILYAGQNDFDSGICPYTEYSKKFHSPIFKNSDEAAVFLAYLAEKNDWNLIYKPHPLCVKHGKCLSDNLPQNLIWVNDVDINQVIDIADVVITILSQVSEIALIRNKATVMLGYTQLRGKDCCYEAYEQNLIETTISSAIESGMTDIQKYKYQEYVARLLKYYLYDDLTDRRLSYGKEVFEATYYIDSKLLKKESEDLSKMILVEAPRYIFIESDMFFDRKMTNELDYLDLLIQRVGKENVIVKLYSEESRMRFEIRGINSFYISLDNWFYMLNNLEDRILVGAYPIYEFEQFSNNKAVWFEKILVAKSEITKNYSHNMPNNYFIKNEDEYLRETALEEA